VTDVVIPLITGFGGVFVGIAFNLAWRVFERRQRRRTLVAALVSEATNHGASLWRRLHQYPRSDNWAPSTDRFYSEVAGYQTAGDVFLAHIPSADVVDPAVIRKLSDAYANLRAAALEAARLAEVGSVQTPMGMTWALKDRLAEIVADLRYAVSLLESVEH
jgi:hypothetical protein